MADSAKDNTPGTSASAQAGQPPSDRSEGKRRRRRRGRKKDESGAPAAKPDATSGATERTAKSPSNSDGARNRRRRQGETGSNGRPNRGRGRGRDGRAGNRGRPNRDASSPLTTGLFSSMADKQMPCRIKGCTGSWLWYGSQQIRGLGKQAPERMCDKHLEQFNSLSDRNSKCRTPGCANTWVWKRGAQFSQLLRGGKMRPPSGLCASCATEERELTDSEVACKVEGCGRHWNWTRDAQMRHRLWVRRQRLKAEEEDARERAEAAAKQTKAEQASESKKSVDEAKPGSEEKASGEARPGDEAKASGESKPGDEGTVQASGDAKAPGAEQTTPGAEQQAKVSEAAQAAAPLEEAGGETNGSEAGQEQTAKAPSSPAGGDGKRKKKRKKKPKRKRRRPIPSDGPPERMCNHCAGKLAAIAPRQVGCKVHGCTNSWTWDRASQLRAWVHLGTDELGVEPTAPRRMCDTCREFCRKHPDRSLDCGRPDCEKQWMYKTGAQLQDYLGGRTLEPNRLCDACIRGGFTQTSDTAPSGGSPIPELECMPCSTMGCSGTWLFVPGQQLEPWSGAGEPPSDRLCDKCRVGRGLDARTSAIKARLSPGPEAQPGAAKPEDSDPAPGDAAVEATAGEAQVSPEAASSDAGEAASTVVAASSADDSQENPEAASSDSGGAASAEAPSSAPEGATKTGAADKST